MKDVNCPYCDKKVDINHDDGYGYSDGETFNQECGHCGKTFVYTTCISFDYDVKEAACLNEGGAHDLQDIIGWPKETFVGRKRWSICNEEFMVDGDANRKAVKEYFESLKKGIF